MKHSIAIFFSAPGPTGFPFSEAVYKDSYMLLASLAEKRGIDVRFVFGEKSYNTDHFIKYWKFEKGELKQYSESFTPSIVYVKSRTHLLDNEKRVNNQFLENICRDKLLTAKTFPDCTKPTFILSETVIPKIQNMKTDKVVIKPRYGESGRSVQVIDKQEIDAALIKNLKEEFIAQELIESSEGIPGLTDRRHELRLFVFNGEIKAAYIRLPAHGSYLANISQGAEVLLIDLKKIPASVISLKDHVDEAFKEVVPRVYTIDVMVENGTPWIVELNDQPGVPDVAVKGFTEEYLNELLTFLNEG